MRLVVFTSFLNIEPQVKNKKQQVRYEETGMALANANDFTAGLRASPRNGNMVAMENDSDDEYDEDYYDDDDEELPFRGTTEVEDYMWRQYGPANGRRTVRGMSLFNRNLRT